MGCGSVRHVWGSRWQFDYSAVSAMEQSQLPSVWSATRAAFCSGGEGEVRPEPEEIVENGETVGWRLGERKCMRPKSVETYPFGWSCEKKGDGGQWVIVWYGHVGPGNMDRVEVERCVLGAA
jgi:hypothetical protein